MSGFGFTEDQEAFRKEVRRFAQRELAPGYRERAKKEGASWETVKRMAEVGLLGLKIPAKYGGQAGDWVSVGIAVEELGKADINMAGLARFPAIIHVALERGPEELKERWLPPLVKGEILGSLALTEPHCGSDAAAITTRAIREGDEYIINGEKASISWATEAKFTLLFAKTDPQAGARGVSCLLVPLDLPGIEMRSYKDTGRRPVRRSSITFQEVRLPATHLVGKEGEGFYLVMWEFDFVRACTALEALGAAQASLEEAIAYAKERTAFGRPIAKFEGVSFKIAEHATLIEAARLLCYRALWLRDQGIPHTKEIAMCKWFGVEVAFNAIHDSLLLHGHFGFTEDLPFEQRLRDALGFELEDAPPQIQKTIISREIIGREFLPYR